MTCPTQGYIQLAAWRITFGQRALIPTTFTTAIKAGGSKMILNTPARRTEARSNVASEAPRFVIQVGGGAFLWKPSLVS